MEKVSKGSVIGDEVTEVMGEGCALYIAPLHSLGSSLFL